MQKMQQQQQQMNMAQPGQGMMQQSSGTMQQQTGVMQPSAGNMPVAKPTTTPMQQPPPLSKKAVASGALPLHYEYIAGDLRMIAILTAISVAILVVLYIFLK
jgi:hypothetical protein